MINYSIIFLDGDDNIANEIGVYYKSNSIKIDVLEESKYTKDELKEWVQKNIIS